MLKSLAQELNFKSSALTTLLHATLAMYLFFYHTLVIIPNSLVILFSNLFIIAITFLDL